MVIGQNENKSAEACKQMDCKPPDVKKEMNRAENTKLMVLIRRTKQGCIAFENIFFLSNSYKKSYRIP